MSSAGHVVRVLRLKIDISQRVEGVVHAKWTIQSKLTLVKDLTESNLKIAVAKRAVRNSGKQSVSFY